MVRTCKRVTSNEPRSLVEFLLLHGPMQRYIYRTIYIPQSLMCHVLDTLSFFLVDGLANCYKKSANEEDLIICLTPWVVLQAACVEAHRPQFL